MQLHEKAKDQWSLFIRRLLQEKMHRVQGHLQDLRRVLHRKHIADSQNSIRTALRRREKPSQTRKESRLVRKTLCSPCQGRASWRHERRAEESGGSRSAMGREPHQLREILRETKLQTLYEGKDGNFEGEQGGQRESYQFMP